MRAATERTKVFPLNINIPREEAIALSLVALETALMSWRRKKVNWSTSMLHTRRNLEIALQHEHGLRHFVQDARARRTAGRA